MDAQSSSPIRPVLVYDRIEKNERDTRLLIGLFALLVLPAMAFLLEYGAVWLLMFSPSLMMQVQSEPQMVRLWILCAGVILLVLLAISLYRYRSAAESTLHLVGAHPPGAEESALLRTLENLCLGAGLPVPALYIVDTGLPNAFSVGLSPERSSLVVTRGLLDLLDRLELEGVIAHELSHIGNRDSRLNTVLAVMLRTLVLPFPIQIVLGLGLVFSLPMLFSADEFFSGFPPEIRFLMVLQAVLVIWALAWPWVGRLIQGAVGRRREFLADADAVRLTRYPLGLARALCKAGSAMAAARPAAWGNPALCHLFLLSAPSWWGFLDPHPSVEARVALLAGMDPQIQGEVLVRASEAGIAHAHSSSDTGQTRQAGDVSGWIDSVPAMFRAGLLGVRNGFLGMAAFFALSSLLPWMLGGRFSPEEAMNSLLIAASLGYALAGYVAARQFASSRRLALLGTCFVLYLLWMVLAVAIFASTGSPFSAGGILRRLLACVILVPIGAAAGAMVQAAFVMGLFWPLRRRVWRSERQRNGRFHFLAPESPEQSEADSGMQKTPGIAEPMGGKSPAVPVPEHRVACPHCGAMMSDTDTACVWCGHKTDA